MKIVKKFILLFIISNLLSTVLFVKGWRNGEDCENHSDYDYDENYGTHDWIGECTLDLLISEEGNKWNWLTKEPYKEIFLLGTESPDNGDVKDVLDGKEVEGKGDGKHHDLYLDEDGEVTNDEDGAAIRVRRSAKRADEALNHDYNFELAAYYLGAMTHYIADMAVFAHVAENYIDPHNLNYDTHHNKFERLVDSRTNDPEDIEEFFKIDDDLKIRNDKKPYDLTVDLAWDTFTDDGGTYNATWLHYNFFEDWVDDYKDRDEDTELHQKYYDRIEESLNNAIETCASAMTYINNQENSLHPYVVPIIVLILSVIALCVTIIYFRTRKNRKS